MQALNKITENELFSNNMNNIIHTELQTIAHLSLFILLDVIVLY